MRISIESEARPRDVVTHTYYTRRNGKVAAVSMHYSYNGRLWVDSFDNDGRRLRVWEVIDGNLTLLWEADGAE